MAISLTPSENKELVLVMPSLSIMIQTRSRFIGMEEKLIHILLLEEAKAEEYFNGVLNGVETLIITAGLSGKTGGTYALCAAWSSEDMNVENVIAFVAMPFSFEGEDKQTVAMSCLENLKILCDDVIIQENDKLDGDISMIDMDVILCSKYAEIFQDK